METLKGKCLGKGKNRQNTEGLQGSKSVLYNYNKDTCHYTFIEPIECTPRVSPKANYGLQMIMMCLSIEQM